MRHELSQFQVNLNDDSNLHPDNKSNGKSNENSVTPSDRESTIESKDSSSLTSDTINNGTNKFEIKKLQMKKKGTTHADDSVSSSPSSSSLASMSSSTSENRANSNNGGKSKKNLIFYSVEDSFPQKKKKKTSSKNNKMLSQNESMSRFKIIQSKPVESQMMKIPYGPPKTSRFFRAAHIKAEPIDLNSAVNSALSDNGTATANAATGTPTSAASANSSSSNAHHYNPYLYAQNRNKANAPFDVLLSVTHQNWDGLREQIKSNHANDAELLFSESDIDFQSIPILRPSVTEFQDPTSYIESVRELGEKFGAVKILPPSTWHSKLNLNSELLWFKARRQLLNSYQNELEARIDFYKRLSEFHKIRKTPPTRLPSIDRRPLDLFKFRNNVRIRGGYEIVCQKKLWAQIGRELGYSGKITSSLSSSLKSAYQRVIYQFDLFEKDEREKKVKNLLNLMR
ncbi:unnamed protein product [[Candida] boidinii]|nr:unnamed protein product [[Candida] boidinii]